MEFPLVSWKREQATFVRGPLPECDIASPFALVFPFYGDRIVLAEITGRGWCIPSGRREAGESPEATARREASEEAGATLGRVVPLGYFVLTEHATGTVRHAPTFVAEVIGLKAIPEGSEATGRMLVNAEDVAGLYYLWDALLAAVFEAAVATRESALPVGTALSEFTRE